MDYSEIATEVARLEGMETTYENCSKLAMLYTILDHKKNSRKALPAISEFIDAFNAADADVALNILDEHFNGIKVLYPKEYNILLDKLKEARV